MKRLLLNLRMPMDIFVDTEYEKDVISKIHDINRSLKRPLALSFWYDKKNKLVSPEVVKRFISQWDSKLPYKTTIAPIILCGTPREFVWFNISHIDDYNTSVWSRFDYLYYNNTPQEVLNGLDAFKDTVLICTRPKQDKPNPKPKRND